MAYIALCLIGAGASWAREPTKEKALERCGKIIVADWSSLYDVAGKPCDINVFDIGDADEIRIGHDGVYDKQAEKFIDRLELATVTLPKKRRR